MPRRSPGIFAAHLKFWRQRRGLSQLRLGIAADVSARHVSFLESGRSQPSREMALRLLAALAVPLRDQNEVLRGAGLDAEFPEAEGSREMPVAISRAVDRMFAAHGPFPITLLDRRYDVLRINQAGARVLAFFVADQGALKANLNAFELLFDPRLARSFVVGWESLARGMVARLHCEALLQPNRADLQELLQSLFAYPGVPKEWRQPAFPATHDPTLVLRLRRDDTELAFLTMVTAFSAPQNVTVEELRIESYFPLDDDDARTCEAIVARA